MNELPHLLEQPERIAVFRALYLGDLLVAVPAFRALRARFPHAEITLIGLSWAAAFVQRFSHYIDRLVVFPGYPRLKEGDGSAEEQARFLREQQAYGYDLVIQMHGSGKTSNRLVQALEGPIALGYYEDKRPTYLQFAAPYPHEQHEIWRNLHLVAQLGCTELDPRMEFPLSDEDYAEADRLLAELPSGADNEQAAEKRSLLIGIHPGSRSPARRWPGEYFAAVADKLAREWNARIVLTGGPGEQETVRDVMTCMNMPALNLAGRTSLGALAALIKKFTLFISNDTGPTHMACAVDTASITIFGPAEYQRWAPLDRSLHRAVRRPVACSPCGYWECPIDHRCLRWLTPDTVLSAAERLIHEAT
jgi:ADP-heptose:LPS heptosyltransferase